MANELISRLGNQWLPLEDMAFWREFQRKFPFQALSMFQRAQMALGIDPHEVTA